MKVCPCCKEQLVFDVRCCQGEDAIFAIYSSVEYAQRRLEAQMELEMKARERRYSYNRFNYFINQNMNQFQKYIMVDCGKTADKAILIGGLSVLLIALFVLVITMLFDANFLSEFSLVVISVLFLNALCFSVGICLKVAEELIRKSFVKRFIALNDGCA